MLVYINRIVKCKTCEVILPLLRTGKISVEVLWPIIAITLQPRNGIIEEKPWEATKALEVRKISSA